MRIKAIIIDFGGVLINWDPLNLFRKNFSNIPLDDIEKFLHEVDFYKWNLLQDKGRSFDEGVAELSSRFPQHAELIRAYHEHWEDSITGSIHGTINIVRKLKDKGYFICGLTNFSVEKFAVIRRKYNFIQLFDRIIVSGEIKMIKPEPGIYRQTLSLIGHDAEECVFIDDSDNNVIAAKELGFIAIRFISPEDLDIKLNKLNLL